MARRVPVLGQDDMLELDRQTVDQRHHLIAAWHRQLTAWAEVILKIDDQKDVPVADAGSFSHEPSQRN